MSRQNRNTHNDDFDNHFNNFLDPFQMMDDDNFGFGSFGNIHQRMQQQFDEMNKLMQDPDAHFGNGDGQYYCSTTTTRSVNGITETKKQVKTNDYEQKEQFKQIGDKRIHAKWNKDRKTGQEDFRRDAVNVKEDEIDDFNKEFDRQAQQMFRNDWPQQYYNLGHRDNSKVSNDKLLKNNKRD